MADGKIPVGISACLVGDEVRFDGGHKRDRFVNDVLGDYFRWVKVCPEVGAGLGVPRETYRLVRGKDGARMVGNRTDRDATDALGEFALAHVEQLATGRLRGFILKKDSPSCGMERVRLYDGNNAPSRTSVGLYAQRLMERYPHLPVEEEGRLNDPRIRENFITRVFTFDRWLRLLEAAGDGPQPRDIVEFHTQHKMLLLAHSPKHYYTLGPLVAKAGVLPMEELVIEYEKHLMAALKAIASPGRHVNVLQHLCGFIKNDLNAADKAELQSIIEDYRVGRVPLVTPLILLYHHLKHLKDEWVNAQVYLQPYPHELALRSHI
jgi:uncharacterized protein YbgA (DUF1722 family)/uncharacterized protein YbbK (DUF523 family)